MRNVQTVTGQGHFYFSHVYENCKMAFFLENGLLLYIQTM